MGRLNVDAMLAEMTTEQLMEWRAALDVIGLDDQWEQTGVICQELHRVAASFGGVSEEPPTRSRFHPPRLTFKQPPPEKTVEQMHKEAAQEAGF